MKSTILLTLLAVLVVVTACHKDQPEMNTNLTDPCSFAKEVSADFDILEISGQTGSNFEKTTPTDTIFHNKSVRFIAKDSTATYTWYIGNEVLTDRAVVRYFDNALIGQNIPITLVVKKDPNLVCFPNDDGYDSITKVFHVSQFPIINIPSIEIGSIEGTYRVKSDHLPDSFDVVFYMSYNNLSQQKRNFENYDGYGSNCLNQADPNGGNYRQSWTNGGTSLSQCDYLIGNIHNRLDGVVEMNFTTKEHVGTPVVTYNWKYLGRKLN